MTDKPDWWQDFYDDNFAAFLDRENDSDLDPAVEFLGRQAGLSQGARIFDQCCGTGALSLAFAKAGYHVTGVDQAAAYIQRAEKKAARRELAARTAFYTGDAFEFTAPQPCDLAVNWYTSTGYDQDDNRNIEMFRRLYESVRPGGKAAVDYMHVPELIAHFREVFTRTVRIAGQDVALEKHGKIDHERGMVATRWIYKFPDGHELARSGESRLYMPKDIVGLLERSGFTNMRLFGDIHGGKLNPDSQRCICIAEKPGGPQ